MKGKKCNVHIKDPETGKEVVLIIEADEDMQALKVKIESKEKIIRTNGKLYHQIALKIWKDLAN